MIRLFHTFTVWVLVCFFAAFEDIAPAPAPQENPGATPSIPLVDRIRIAEAFRLAEELGDEIWYDWSKTPFALLLVTQDYEFLMRHPNPSEDFMPVGFDSLLKSQVLYRRRTFQTNLLATFPAVNGLTTIVIGQAENTESKNSTR